MTEKDYKIIATYAESNSLCVLINSGVQKKNGRLCSSILDPRPSTLILGPYPQPLALGLHLVGPRPPKYCKTKYNTII